MYQLTGGFYGHSVTITKPWYTRTYCFSYKALNILLCFRYLFSWSCSHYVSWVLWYRFWQVVWQWLRQVVWQWLRQVVWQWLRHVDRQTVRHFDIFPWFDVFWQQIVPSVNVAILENIYKTFSFDIQCLFNVLHEQIIIIIPLIKINFLKVLF